MKGCSLPADRNDVSNRAPCSYVGHDTYVNVWCTRMVYTAVQREGTVAESGAHRGCIRPQATEAEFGQYRAQEECQVGAHVA